MELYYGQTPTRFSEGKKFRNPRNFMAAEAEATKVFIVGYFPRVVAAYKRIGIQPVVIEANDPRLGYPEGQYQPAEGDYMRTTAPAMPAGGQSESLAEIPEGWEMMPWADLRRLAASLSATTIVNKEQAGIAIRAELERRRGPAAGEA